MASSFCAEAVLLLREWSLPGLLLHPPGLLSNSMVGRAEKMCKYHRHLGLTWTLFSWQFEVALVTAYSCSFRHMAKSIIGKWCHLQCCRELPFLSVVSLVLWSDMSLSNSIFFLTYDAMQEYYIVEKCRRVTKLPDGSMTVNSPERPNKTGKSHVLWRLPLEHVKPSVTCNLSHCITFGLFV